MKQELIKIDLPFKRCKYCSEADLHIYKKKIGGEMVSVISCYDKLTCLNAVMIALEDQNEDSL